MEQRVIDELRSRYNFPAEANVTDEQIIEMSTGTMDEALVRRSLAIDDFKKALCEAMPKVLQRYFGWDTQ